MPYDNLLAGKRYERNCQRNDDGFFTVFSTNILIALCLGDQTVLHTAQDGGISSWQLPVCKKLMNSNLLIWRFEI